MSPGTENPDIEIETPRGPARIRVTDPAGPPASPATSVLVIGHGAGGGVDAPDILAVRDAVTLAGVRVVQATQPYRVAGRRVAAPIAQLDEAWTAIVQHLKGGDPAVRELPLIFGGRSSGARVACRTATALGAAGVLCLAFPLHPPGKPLHPPGKPEKSRAGELPDGVPTLVLNGDRDPFGVPAPGPLREVAVRPGATHDLRKDVKGTAELAADWFRRHGWAR